MFKPSLKGLYLNLTYSVLSKNLLENSKILKIFLSHSHIFLCSVIITLLCITKDKVVPWLT